MSSTWIELRSSSLLVLILFLQLVAYGMVFFDVPVARQVFGFFYFTFVPGFILIRMVKLEELDRLETILVSAGLGIAFLMLAGLSINGLSSIFGFSSPISAVPLMIGLTNAILIGAILIYFRDDTVRLWNWKLLSSHSYIALLPCLPILSVVGAIWAGTYGQNWILLLVIMAILLLFVTSVAFHKRLPSEFYPIAIFMIALALLYHTSFVSPYIVSFGSDSPLEYFVFKNTQNSAFWSSTLPSYWGDTYGRANAMLSITILPATYSSLLNMDPILVFKVLNPLVFSLVPLCLYQMWRMHIGKKYAFVSAFLFMAMSTFYSEMFGLNRQMIGELFFVLLLFVIFNKKIRSVEKMGLFAVFSVALVVSHYALAEILLFFFVVFLIFQTISKRRNAVITTSMIVLFFVIMFTWYIYTSGSAVFDSLVQFGNQVYSQLSDFFDPGSRGETVLRGLGMEAPPTIWNAISRLFAYLTEALIAIGFVAIVTKRIKPSFDRGYLILTSIAMGFLAGLVIVPGLANTLNMTRFYHILLIFLAPLCILGAEALAGFFFKKRTQMASMVLLLIVLAPYFLFQTDFVYEITRSESYSLALSMYRMDGYKLYRGMGYIPEENVVGAYWLLHYVDLQYARVYADMDSRGKALVAYGLIPSPGTSLLSNTTKVVVNGTVFLGRLNVVDGIVDSGSMLLNTSELSPLLDDLSKIYSNGGSEIYQNTYTTLSG